MGLTIMKIFFVLIFFFFFSNVAFAQNLLDDLVPHPRQSYLRHNFKATFRINSETKIFINDKTLGFANRLNNELMKNGYDSLSINYWNEKDTIVNGIVLSPDYQFTNQLLTHINDQKISIDSDYPGEEGYIIDVMPNQLIVSGSDSLGLNYGITTLMQVINLFSKSIGIQPCRIIDAPAMPNRWVFKMSNLYVDKNVTELKKLIDTSAKYKLNAIALSDTKFNRLDDLYPKYNDSLLSFDKYCKENYIKFIPNIFPFGYSSAILSHDPNLASGLPVRNQKFYIENDTARFIPSSNVSLQNPGFENYSDNKFSGFLFIDKPGQISFVDTIVKHSGKASIRLENFSEYDPNNGHGRICALVQASKFKLYHISAWVRTENLVPDGLPTIAVISKTSHQNLSFYDINIPSTSNGWKKVDMTFNTLDNDSIYVYWGVWGAKNGKIWWDDLNFEEVPFVNILRRQGTPVNVTNQSQNISYTESVDFDSLIDPMLSTYSPYHTPPTFGIMPNGNINNGDTLLISYYHKIIMHTSQVMVTMSDPKVYEIIEKEFKILDSLLNANTYFMQHDEIRTMNWDYGDQSRNLTPAEILADNVNKCYDIIQRNHKDADVWVWSDMFDEFHNAVSGNYYLVNGDLRGSADLIPKSIGMMNWNGRDKDSIVFNSLNFFEQKGFRQMSAPFYDQDENQIRRWKEWTQHTNNFKGMMYTTWQNDYSYLRYFAEYAWNNAPYIYHEPQTYLPNADSLRISIRIVGDRWDKDWELENSQILYRSNPNNRFTSISLNVDSIGRAVVNLPIDKNSRFLQYYITAIDNKGWQTKIPFGENKYFELGAFPNYVESNDNNNSLRIYGVYPNPINKNQEINIKWSSSKPVNCEISLINILGIRLKTLHQNTNGNSIENTLIKLNELPMGVYFIKMNSGNETKSLKIFIK